MVKCWVIILSASSMPKALGSVTLCDTPRRGEWIQIKDAQGEDIIYEVIQVVHYEPGPDKCGGDIYVTSPKPSSEARSSLAPKNVER